MKSDKLALDVLGGACLRVWRHRSRDPEKRLCWRRAAASPGAARRARLWSRGSHGPKAHNLWRGGTRQQSPHSRCRYHRLHVVEEEEKGRKVEQEVEREDQDEETAHTSMAMEMT